MGAFGGSLNWIETMEEMIVFLAMAAMRVTAWCNLGMMVLLVRIVGIFMGKCWLKYCRSEINYT